MVDNCVILFRKNRDGSVVKSSYADFGFAVTDAEWSKISTKKPATRDWLDQDGLDAYIPSVLRVGEGELSVSFVCKGNLLAVKQQELRFKNYLYGRDNTGGEFSLYDSFNKKGVANAYIKEYGEPSYITSNNETILEVEVSFALINPNNEIVLSYVGD